MLALSGNLANINNANVLAQHERTAKLKADRAVLPLALTKIVQVAHDGMSFSLKDDSFYKSAKNADLVARQLALDEVVLTTLKQCIEFSDPLTQRWISALIANFQVSNSRLVGAIADPDRVVSEGNKRESAFDWAAIYALTIHLFKFARGSLEQVPEKLDVNNIRIPLSHPDCHSQDFVAAQKFIIRNRDKRQMGSIDSFELN